MTLLTIIRILHLMGLIMGLGGAMLLDFSLLTRAIIRPVSEYTLHHMKVISRVVTVGLVVLWITGFILIYLNYQIKPEYITNPKLWAKVIIVFILTLNGYYIHNYIMPFIKKRLGYRLLFNAKKWIVAEFSLVASISFVSWFTPFVLGKASELNYVVPMWQILGVYAACLTSLWILMFIGLSFLLKIQVFIIKLASKTAKSNSLWEELF